MVFISLLYNKIFYVAAQYAIMVYFVGNNLQYLIHLFSNTVSLNMCPHDFRHTIRSSLSKIFEFQTKRVGLVQFFYCSVYQLTLQYDDLRWCTVYNHGYGSS